MLHFDQRGDDLCDLFGLLWVRCVEVHSELRSRDPFHDSVIDQQWRRVSRYKNLQIEGHSNGDRRIPGNVAPAQRKIFDDSFAGNPFMKISHRQQSLEPVILPHDKPSHCLSFLIGPVALINCCRYTTSLKECLGNCSFLASHMSDGTRKLAQCAVGSPNRLRLDGGNCFRTSQPVDYFRPIFTSPTQPKYNASEPIMAGQKPKRGTPAIMETT